MDLICTGMKIKSSKKKKNQISCAANKKVHSKQFLLESNILVNSNCMLNFRRALWTFLLQAVTLLLFVYLKKKKNHQPPLHYCSSGCYSHVFWIISEFRNSKVIHSLGCQRSKKVLCSSWRSWIWCQHFTVMQGTALDLLRCTQLWGSSIQGLLLGE